MTTARLSVTEETRDRIKAFASGLRTEYDLALRYMLKKLAEESDNPFGIGQELRAEFERMLESGELDWPGEDKD